MNQGKWIRKAKNGLNIIFIHGINSSEECWRHENGSYWPKLLEDEKELADIGIYVFSYRTGINTGSYSLSDIVDSLREHFGLDKLIDSTAVVFVCHSMGGIVIRRFLVNQHLWLIEEGLNKIGLFLVASPSLGSNYANMLSLISNVMGHSQANALKFSQNNVWLNDLDKDFINLQESKYLRIKGKELIEDLPLYLKGLIKKQVVEPFSGAKYFGKSFKVPGSDHSTIATPTDSSAIQHRLLVQFIKDFIVEELGEAAEKGKGHQSLEVTKARDLRNSSFNISSGKTDIAPYYFNHISQHIAEGNNDCQIQVHNRLTSTQFVNGVGTEQEQAAYFYDAIGFSKTKQTFFYVEQHKAYREAWKSLYALKLHGDNLWEEASMDNLIKFAQQLKLTSDLINNDSILFDDQDYQKLLSVLHSFEQFQIGKKKLIDIRSKEDIKEEESKGSSIIIQNDIDQINKNERYKLKYEEVLASIRTSFYTRLSNFS